MKVLRSRFFEVVGRAVDPVIQGQGGDNNQNDQDKMDNFFSLDITMFGALFQA